MDHFPTRRVFRSWKRGAGASLVAAVIVAGCSRDAADPTTQGILGPHEIRAFAALRDGAAGTRHGAVPPPSDIVTVGFAGHELRLWPYTGSSFDGTASDPINLVFVGKADPRRLRAALLALDGDRTPFHLPDEYPFNATWSDANGGVQTAWADGEGWIGNVVQLQLGRYQLGRVHLRLFRTGSGFGDGGVWTLGGAHFEILIPGTADHQVLSWEVARNLVVIDLMRTGLLDVDVPMVESDVISATPTFREIPAILYNALPAALRQLIDGPPVPVSAPVGIPSIGTATILNLAVAAPIAAGSWSDDFTLTYDLVVPKPFCNATGMEYVHLAGPIWIHQAVTIDAAGELSYVSSLSGQLQVTPLAITATSPEPSGSPYFANVLDEQSGMTTADAAWVQSMVKRIGTGDRGALVLMTKLRVGTNGRDSYQAKEMCLGPE